MKTSTRLHIYPPTGPKDNAYLIADRSALKSLSQAINNASNSAAGFEIIKFYSSDGHEYNLIITSDVEENEWQSITSHYRKEQAPVISTIQNYMELKEELQKTQTK